MKRQLNLLVNFGTGNSTLTDLKKNESRIRSFVSSMESLSVCSKECKIIWLADDEKVVQKRSQGIPITGKFTVAIFCHLFKLALACSGNFVNDMGSGSCLYKVKSFHLT